MEEIELIPMGIIEGISTKTQKEFKFYRYLYGRSLATCDAELAANDVIKITQKGDYYNITKASGAAFKVKLIT
jgi:hypothetical protein